VLEGRRGQVPSPASRAAMMAWARSATCSLVKMFETLLRTVLSDSPSRLGSPGLSGVRPSEPGCRTRGRSAAGRHRCGPVGGCGEEPHQPLRDRGPEDRLAVRDGPMLMLACQTGLRATELTQLTVGDAHLGAGAHVSCLGKGRKQRITPLTATTVTVLAAWLIEHGGRPADPLFPTRAGTPLSRDALERRVTKYTATAARSCPTLHEKKISPHTLRHSAAMRLLNAGVDVTVIALWLGHENVATTRVYIHADLALKERALARTAPQDAAPGRYQRCACRNSIRAGQAACSYSWRMPVPLQNSSYRA
jgi:hypothetical protein